MFQLKLSSRTCISCGICMDVCRPRAIAMRIHRGATVEGPALAYLAGPAGGDGPPRPMMTFPYLAAPDRCDGCRDCVDQCPTSALALVPGGAGAPAPAAGALAGSAAGA